MRKFIYILLLFAVGFSVNDTQKEFIVLNWEIADEKEFPLGITFNNAGYDEISQFVPFYFETINLENSQSDYHITVENAVFENFPFKSGFLENKNLPTDIKIETNRLKSGNEYKLQVRVSTVINRENEILFLKSFTIKRIPVQAKKAEVSVNTWVSGSVLKSGNWIKIKTAGKGIYKIPYSKLTSWGFSNPANVNVFGNGGLQLSENPGELTFDDLEQCAVWHGQNNGVNCLFFYEPGNILWEPDNTKSFFRHKNHDYTDAGYFFLTDNTGSVKLAAEYSGISEPATHQITDYDTYDVFESELSNLINSGKNWYGDKLGHNISKTINFNLSDWVTDKKVQIKVNAVARSYQPSVLQVHANSEYLGILNFSNVNTDDPTGIYADEKSGSFLFTNNRENLEIKLTYAAGNSNALSWIDFVEVNYRKKLVLKSGQLFFRDLKSVGAGNILGFTIESSASGVQVFDVTNVNNVTKVPVTVSGGTITGKRPAGELREYVAFNPNGNFQEPELVGKVENQNLHGMTTPEYLIITHPVFVNSAKELAEFHKSNDGLKTEVVIAEQIYNEFGSGQFNATAIRNFIKMFYERGNTLKYVLLFGDGSYDNKNIKLGGYNFLPTYQSENSLNPIASFITDDYFVILDNGETVFNGAEDIGIGRLPVSTRYQAEVVVSKIKNYNSEKAFGEWRNVLSFIADDEDGNLHLNDSENLSNLVNKNHKNFIIDKIYLDAFKQKTTTSGEEYPDVTEAINKRVAEGTLILNYVGHANERFLAQEKVLDISHINSWTNSYALPVFVTATCEFSRFDGDEMSAGENILFNPNGGGIGLFSTTRVVISGPNFALSTNFYNQVFERDSNGKPYRLGDIMRLAKLNTSGSNKRNFSLLADPALKLSYPEHKVVTTTINQQNAMLVTDTIGAMQKITVSGYIADYKGNILPNFSGEIKPSVFDKEMVVSTMGNHANDKIFPSPVVSYKIQENVIYKGVARVVNGEFSFSFIVPKDISYKLGKGKIVYYATNGITDAGGAFENFVIGGPGLDITDNKGPEIKLFLDSEKFKSGDKTSRNPLLLAHISDENGINTTGNGFGHDITAVLDNDYSNVFVLNNYYRSNIDDYKSGTIQFQLSDLKPGQHTLKLKAWDVANNSTEAEVDFIVADNFAISEVSCYPNPLNDYTYFIFEHNLAGETFDAVFEIFDIQGKRIDYFVTKVTSNGLVSNPVRWDLKDLKVAAENGMYICKITVKSKEGLMDSKSGKFIIVN